MCTDKVDKTTDNHPKAKVMDEAERCAYYGMLMQAGNQKAMLAAIALELLELRKAVNDLRQSGGHIPSDA